MPIVSQQHGDQLRAASGHGLHRYALDRQRGAGTGFTEERTERAQLGKRSAPTLAVSCGCDTTRAEHDTTGPIQTPPETNDHTE